MSRVFEKATNIQFIAAYNVGEGFIVEITLDSDKLNSVNDVNGSVYEAYLYHQDYGIKSHIIGWLNEDEESLNSMLNYLCESIDSDIDYYKETYMDK